MALDGKLLRKAQDRVDARRAENQRRWLARREAVYEKLPRVEALDGMLSRTAAQVIAQALISGGDPEAAVEELKGQNFLRQEERARALMEGGYPADWLDEKFDCPRCRDTGYVMGEPCSCLMDYYKEEQAKELSALLKLGEETFDSFNLDYYSGPARDKMEMVYELCLEYARKFSKKSPNLFLVGGTGLGKTYLSTCIAKVVSEQGFSVIYDTAVGAMAKFEAEKFGGDDGTDARRLLTCDLLIIDDLGTEMITAFTQSALYTLINGRLVAGKQTVINSNLSGEELRRRYSPQIVSRLEGEYSQLRFEGRDVRLLKKQRGLS